jgi:hypothetical protein
LIDSKDLETSEIEDETGSQSDDELIAFLYKHGAIRSRSEETSETEDETETQSEDEEKTEDSEK